MALSKTPHCYRVVPNLSHVRHSMLRYKQRSKRQEPTLASVTSKVFFAARQDWDEMERKEKIWEQRYVERKAKREALAVSRQGAAEKRKIKWTDRAVDALL